MTRSALLFIFFCFLREAFASDKERFHLPSYYAPHPIGDPRNCRDTSTRNRLEVLPGMGWDNLQNLDMGQVLSVNYSQCKTTSDRKYLLPDNTFVIPIKRSRVDMFSQTFDHWSNYSSTTAASINLEVSYLTIASGSFSTDFQYNKERQVNDKAMTTRVQMRHLVYTVKAQPDSPLHPAFRNRLMQIAAELQNNETRLAWYNAQLLVREFGTHYTTTVDAGAILVQEDHVKQNFVRDKKRSESDIKAAASATFFSKVGLKAGFERKASEEVVEQYRGNQTSSRVFTHGGPPYRANFTVADWENNLDNELVGIDRNGDPLHFAITPSTMPGLPQPTVRRLAKIVQRAVGLYYKINTVSGCTNEDSANFNYHANVNDGSCNVARTNFTFGGVYQKCSLHRGSAENICAHLVQKNPLTGDFSCPQGYQAVPLLQPMGQNPSVSKSSHQTQCYERCHSCGFLWLKRCCKNECRNVFQYSQANFETYWCAAKGVVPQHSGVLFGGVYSKNSPNPATGSQCCPNRFYALPIGGHAHVCVSDDYELGFQYSLPFGGFFSCSVGNPLAIPRKAPQGRNSLSARSFSHVELFFESGNGAQQFHGPKHCPPGYSQHLVTLDNECEINYCIKANALSDRGKMIIRRPPFCPLPMANPNATEALSIVGVNGNVWFKNETTNDWAMVKFAVQDSEPPSEPSQNGAQKESISPGTAAVISVCVTALAGILIAAMFIGFKRRRRTERRMQDGLLESYVNGETTPLNSGQATGQQ